MTGSIDRVDTDTLIRGVIPVLPAIFTDDEELDLAGQRATVRHLAEAGADAICVHANFSEQFSLTDDERQRILDAVAEEAAGTVPLVVTVSHYSTRLAGQRARAAADAGAAVVMMMPPFFGATLRCDDAAVVEQVGEVAEAAGLPVMIQDAPMSTTPLSTELLARLAREIDLVRYVKVEIPRAAPKIRALAELTGDDLPGLYDGEEAVTLIPDLEAGVVGCMSSGLLTHELGETVRRYAGGDHDGAEAMWESLLPLIQFENRECGPAATKALLKEAGIIRSDAVRRPFPTIHPALRPKLVELARRRDIFLLRGV